MNKENLIGLTEKQRENKKEDKKALKKFFWILVLAFFTGIVVGIGSAFIGDVLENQPVKEAILTALQYLAIYGGYFFTTVLLIVSIVLYQKSRKEYIAWDEEDEEVLEGLETKISYVIWFSNLIMFGSYFFFATGVWAVGLADAKAAVEQSNTGFWFSLGTVFLHMVYALIVSCVIQQKTVNLMKEINPEKQGSIYDTKFQDKWLANCDEAERFAAYKCSFKTFKVMQLTGMVLWIICLIGQMIFGTGVFATIIVTVFMIIQISVYSVQGIYFAKHPSEVMK
ncbi:MAG: DUF3169 family protein [Lachnospiraceae bacterium]|nr:DUF3169 family protein [Lachnospiraceae bacterium]